MVAFGRRAPAERFITPKNAGSITARRKVAAGV
jgi:hypothetical protein